MARKQRINYPGAVYHVIARGNNRDKIFNDTADKIRYLDLLTRYKAKYEFSLFAYVLMDNHLHMLMQVRSDPLSKIMQGLQLTYTQYVNRKYVRVGHVFEQRYKALICEDYAYLIKLLCYIHQNPVRAKLSGGINYSWSSHPYYNCGQNGLVTPNFILDMLSEDREQATTMYRQLVEVPLVREDVAVKEKVGATVSISEPAVDDLCSMERCSPEHHHLTLEDLAEKLSAEHGIDAKDLLAHCRVRKVVKARNQFIFEAVEQGLASKSELARLLALDPARITQVYQESATSK